MKKEQKNTLFIGLLYVKKGLYLDEFVGLLEGEEYKIQEMTDYGNYVLVCVHGLNRGVDFEFNVEQLTEYFKIK